MANAQPQKMQSYNMAHLMIPKSPLQSHQMVYWSKLILVLCIYPLLACAIPMAYELADKDHTKVIGTYTNALVDQYKPTEVEKGYNLFYSLSEGLNEVGIKEVKKIELEAVKKVFEVMNNKEFIGSIPYFSIFMSDVLGLTPTDELKREVLQWKF